MVVTLHLIDEEGGRLINPVPAHVRPPVDGHRWEVFDQLAALATRHVGRGDHWQTARVDRHDKKAGKSVRLIDSSWHLAGLTRCDA